LSHDVFLDVFHLEIFSWSIFARNAEHANMLSSPLQKPLRFYLKVMGAHSMYTAWPRKLWSWYQYMHWVFCSAFVTLPQANPSFFLIGWGEELCEHLAIPSHLSRFFQNFCILVINLVCYARLFRLHVYPVWSGFKITHILLDTVGRGGEVDLVVPARVGAHDLLLLVVHVRSHAYAHIIRSTTRVWVTVVGHGSENLKLSVNCQQDRSFGNLVQLFLEIFTGGG